MLEGDVPIGFDEYWSHIRVRLEDHLRRVSELASRYASQALIDAEASEAAKLAGITHDIGKYTTFFQEMLRSRRGRDELTRHSPLSSLAAALEALERFDDVSLQIAVYLSVRYHHERLPSLKGAIEKLKMDLVSQSIMRQLDDIRREDVVTELRALGLDAAVKLITNRDDALSKLQEFEKRIEFLPFNPNRTGDVWRTYYTILVTYSSLVDADRRDAAAAAGWERVALPVDLVVRFRRERFGPPRGRVDEIREEFFRKVDSFPPHGQGIVTIRAPTGSGKTLSGFHLALRMRDGRRIIYSLPFINIIEQNYSVLKDVVSLEVEPSPGVILKKHHLSVPGTEDGVSLDEVLLLADSFDSEVVLTTFVQLLSSLFSNRGSELRKLHNVANSVIILDEVQSIPAEYWRLVREALEGLVRNTRARIVLMTATMPALLGRGLPGVGINPKISRYRIRYRPDVASMEDLVQLFSEVWERRKSVLLVLNTIETSIEAYRGIRKAADHGDTLVAYLSSNVVPKQREERIERIREALADGRPVICVSTQVVEAGVDLDFEAVIRDIAPLDSIVQAAGRCNRHGRFEEGEVHVIRLDDGKHARRVYGTLLIRATESLLEGKRSLREVELESLMESYYDDLERRIDLEGGSKEYINAVMRLDFEHLSRFSIIEEEPKVSVFVEVDEAAAEVRERFKGSYDRLRRMMHSGADLREVFRAKAELRMARVELERYVVNVRDPRGLPEWVAGMRIIDREVLDAYYDLETGFKTGDGLERGELIW